MRKSKAYAERSDLEKIQSQWNKLTGLHEREEPSAAIVRAATAAELAASYAVRKEFAKKGDFQQAFVDSLLMWANGLSGKLDRLLIPITLHQEHHEVMTELKSLSNRINKKRKQLWTPIKPTSPDAAFRISLQGIVRNSQKNKTILNTQDLRLVG